MAAIRIQTPASVRTACGLRVSSGSKWLISSDVTVGLGTTSPASIGIASLIRQAIHELGNYGDLGSG